MLFRSRHAPTLNQNLTRGMIKGNRLLIQSPTPLLPLLRSSGGRASLPLPDVGKWFPSAVHCRQRVSKEPHLNRGCEVAMILDHNIPTIETIGWLHQGQDLHVSQQCHLPYNIKPFTDKVLCDIAPLDVSHVLLGQK